MTLLSVSQFFEDLREDLDLVLLGGKGGLSRKISQSQFQKNGLALTGYLSPIHPDRIQVWGHTELSYLKSLGESSRTEAVVKFFSLPLCAVLITGGRGEEAMPEGIEKLADKANVPVIRSIHPGREVLPHLLEYLESRLAPQIGRASCRERV